MASDSARDRALAILNPVAGGGRARRAFARREAQLRARCDELRVVETEGVGHATELARSALEAGTTLLVSVGGDGTNNEILAGMVGPQGSTHPSARLAFVPAGTGGDFSRSLAKLDPGELSLDYGWAELEGSSGPISRPFLNMASVGISGLVDRYVADGSRRLGATVTYVAASLRAIKNYRNVDVELRVDGGPSRSVRLTLMCLGNGQYFGGGMWACPEARLDDGFFDTVLLDDLGKGALVGALAAGFRGRHLGRPGVVAAQGREIELRPALGIEEPVLIDLDGEQIGRLPARFRIVRAALPVLHLG